MLVPSEIRKQLDPNRDGEAFFLVMGVDGRPWLYPEQYYEQLVSTERHPKNWGVSKPARANGVYADNIILFDGTELPPNFDRQYVTSFELDKTSQSSLHGWTVNPKTPSQRYRGNVNLDTDPDLGDGYFIAPGNNLDSGEDPQRGNIRWRHGRNDMANFLFADGSVKTMKMTLNYGTPRVKGEVVRKYLRPKAPTNYLLIP
jgi:prepilin-type processing-associated H-X9-DG protein